MPKISSTIILVFIFAFTSPRLFGQNNLNLSKTKETSKEWFPLLDETLSQWEVWTGVPEPSVKNLPSNYKKKGQGKNKTPIGLGDPMGIFKVTKEANGELVLNISGEIYAGLTSKKEFSNYHLTLLFKWGEKKYKPRLNRKRDNGLLYHCHGEHGAFWNVWKSCLEYQIQEGDFGDLYTLAGTTATIPVDDEGKWKPDSEKLKKTGRIIRRVDAESPYGEWTRVDLYVVGDSAVHVTNGEVVMAITNAKTKDGNKLDAGEIQLQSEAAECYMKDINIRPISEFPNWIKKETGFQ